MARRPKAKKIHPPLLQVLRPTPELLQQEPEFAAFLETMDRLAAEMWTAQPHGDAPKWQAHIAEAKTAFLEQDTARLRAALMGLHPWRRGPYLIACEAPTPTHPTQATVIAASQADIAQRAATSLYLDSEWQCFYKWDRIAHLDWQDKSVLDIGASNGYYLFRALQAGARLAIGFDPTRIDLHQFAVLKTLAVLKALKQADHALIFPLRDDALDHAQAKFDRVMSMGVLYHHRDPVAHIRRLLAKLEENGELVLETIVAAEHIVEPPRYAKMRNISFIPDLAHLDTWIREAGGKLVDRLGPFPTLDEEQRQSEWMHFESLADFLDPDNPTKTVEGYPAPTRVISIIKITS